MKHHIILTITTPLCIHVVILKFLADIVLTINGVIIHGILKNVQDMEVK